MAPLAVDRAAAATPAAAFRPKTLRRPAAAAAAQPAPARATAARAPAACRLGDAAGPRARRGALAAARAAADGVEAPPRQADVYESPPELLKEGVRRHTISVFVADETGMINRVAGVFARRGYNIESLAVGLNIDRALFTIVVIGTDEAIAQLMKQIYKLPNVIKVEDLTYASCVERGLMLVKVDAVPPQRSAILELAGIFRAAVVDVTERSIMLAVTGDPGKTRAFQRAMSAFGVLAVARTGKLALRREQAHNESRRQQLLASARARAEAEAAAAGGAGESARAEAPSSAAPAPAAAGGAGDVYKLEAEDLTGVWDFAVLNPYFSDEAGDGGPPSVVRKRARGAYKPHTLSLLVDNAPGVLDRVTGVIARRNYNVQSLGVGPAETHDVSRITLVVPGTDGDCAKLLHQLRKLTPVREATDITNVPFVERELMLAKVAADKSMRGELMDLAGVFRAKISDISADTLTVEATGDCEKLAQLQELLKPYGLVEVARTGRVALTRDSGVNTALLEEIASDPFFA